MYRIGQNFVHISFILQNFCPISSAKHVSEAHVLVSMTNLTFGPWSVHNAKSIKEYKRKSSHNIKGMLTIMPMLDWAILYT